MSVKQLPLEQRVVNNMCTHYWVKDVVELTKTKDPVDVIKNLTTLLAIAYEREGRRLVTVVSEPC